MLLKVDIIDNSVSKLHWHLKKAQSDLPEAALFLQQKLNQWDVNQFDMHPFWLLINCPVDGFWHILHAYSIIIQSCLLAHVKHHLFLTGVHHTDPTKSYLAKNIFKKCHI